MFDHHLVVKKYKVLSAFLDQYMKLWLTFLYISICFSDHFFWMNYQKWDYYKVKGYE